MNYQVGSACYGTPLQAAQVQASTVVGSVVQHGSAAYVVGLSAVADDSITYVLNPIGGGVAITSQIPFQAQPCNLLTAGDALLLSWQIIGVWVAVYAIKFLGKSLYGAPGGSDYGNA